MRVDSSATLIISFATMLYMTLLVLMVGCGPKKEAAKPKKQLTEQDAMQAMYDTAVTRLRNRDKSGLYDIEFEYIKEKFTFADYQDFPQIRTVEADTTDSIRIDSLSFFGDSLSRDSAEVWATAVFRGPTNVPTYLPGIRQICYFHQGRWIRPTVGVIQNQLSFDSLKNAAFDAANKESGG